MRCAKGCYETSPGIKLKTVNYFCTLLWMFLSSAEQSLMAVARIRTASDGGILLCANCTQCLLNLQSPSKQRIHCMRLKDINFCQAGRKGSNVIISPL